MTHPEPHRSHRGGWLRAAVLGANDGIVSTASLIIGVAAAGAAAVDVVIAGLAGLVAGAMSMAAGEYVSVSSQADIEAADLAIERRALDRDYAEETDELAAIYVARGLDATLAQAVAEQLMAHDALDAHARDEIGITDAGRARPVLAAASSAASFTVGAAVPLGVTAAAPAAVTIPVVATSTIALLVLLGAVSARIGGASMPRAAARIAFWGAFAMAATAAVGDLVQQVL